MSFKAIAETHGPEAARRVFDEAREQHADLGLDLNKLRRTHVVVGDHAPERIVNHDACDCGDGSTVAQCRGQACKAHNRCCWQ